MRIQRGSRTTEGRQPRETAPALFGLLERCAAQLQAPVPDFVFMNGAFNAGTRNVGLRRRNLLVLGVPLWNVLTGPERVALLGHELAHHVNRDVTRGILATSARRSLAEWMKLFNPRETRRDRLATRRLGRSGGFASGAALLMPVALVVCFGPAFLLAFACHRWLTRLDLRCGQRAEHLADELGARLGSTAAAMALIERLALAESVGFFLRRQIASHSTDDPWPLLRAYLASIPEHEKRRRMLVDEQRAVRIDATHPANYLRRRMLAARPRLPGTVTADAAEWSEIDRELSKYYAIVAHNLVRAKAK